MRASWEPLFMFESKKIGRIAGIDLYIHPTFWLLLGFVLLTQGSLFAVVFTAAIFGCVVLHEFGHALTARSFGIGTRDITIYPIGGVARLSRMPKSPGAELLISLAGPAVNLVIAAVLGLAVQSSVLSAVWERAAVVDEFARDLVLANLALAVFNMIPAFPMDGGRVVRALLSGLVGRLRATEIAAALGQALAIGLPIVLMFLGMFSFMHVILAAFVFMAARAELASVRAESRARSHVPPAGYRWVDLGGGMWQLVPITVGTGGAWGHSGPWQRH